MYDAGKIITGLLIGIGLVSFPFWYNQGKAAPPPELKMDTPVIQQMKEKQCIEPTPYMRANHMELIDSWRNAVVREGGRLYMASDGKKYLMSLSNTCLHCHSNKDKFCDRCHSYTGVSPACWSCHVVPKEMKG
jgi:hypothetical protein